MEMKIKLDKKVLIPTLIFLLSLFASCIIVDYDFDLFARLQVGETFFKTFQVMKADPYSYTPTHIWYDHEWGSGVVFYAFLKLFGPFGLILLNAILLAFTAVFILKTSKTKYPLLVSSLFIGAITLTNGTIVRCQSFTFLLLAVFLWLLEGYRAGKYHKSGLWIFPILSIIWNNLHGGVVSGLGIMAIYIAGLLISKKECRNLIISFCLSVISLIINPWGIKYLFFLFFASTMRRELIIEWDTIFYPYYILHILPMLIIVFVPVIIKLFNNYKTKKIDLIHYAVIAITMYMGLMHRKLLGLILVTVLSYFCETLPYFDRFREKIEKGVSYAIIVLALLIPLSSPMVPRATFSQFPLTEIEFLKINNIKGNLLVSFELGSLTSYKLYPNNLIYMDGRYEEVYYEDVFIKLFNFLNVKENWKAVLDDYPTQILFVERDYPAYKAMQKEKDWVNIFTGYNSGVFVKKEAVKDTYLLPPRDIDYYRKNLFDR